MAPLDLAVIFLYFALTIGVGLWVSRSQATAGDYFLGARNLPAWIETVKARRPHIPVYGSQCEANEYMTRMTNIIDKHGGIVDKFVAELQSQLAEKKVAADGVEHLIDEGKASSGVTPTSRPPPWKKMRTGPGAAESALKKSRTWRGCSP